MQLLSAGTGCILCQLVDQPPNLNAVAAAACHRYHQQPLGRHSSADGLSTAGSHPGVALPGQRAKRSADLFPPSTGRPQHDAHA